MCIVLKNTNFLEWITKMPTLEIKLKNGENMEIFFKENTLITRKQPSAKGGLMQIWHSTSDQWTLGIRVDAIKSVEKRDGIILGLPNKK